MTSQQAPEEPFSRSPIPLGLQTDINHFDTLINSSPQRVLPAVYPYEDFVDEECVAVTSMLSLQYSSIWRTKLVALLPDCFVADCYPALSQEILVEWSGTTALFEIEPGQQPGVSVTRVAPEQGRLLHLFFHDAP